MDPVITVGADIGKRRDPTAIAVSETGERPTGRDEIITDDGLTRTTRAELETIWTVHRFERLPLGTSYPLVAQRLRDILTGIQARLADEKRLRRTEVRLVVDATGVGQPVVDLLADDLDDVEHVTLTPVWFTSADSITGRVSGGEVKLGKPWFVSYLQALLQTGRIRLPDRPETADLAQELLDYEVRVTESANLVAGAFKTGSHDDLVTAVGLACLDDPRMGRVEYGPEIYG